MPMDSHPDPTVARVLIPDGERGEFRTNSIGMRERPFETPKPAGLVRIVLLGDSYVFGLNIPAEARLGAFLERFLAERSPPGARFECLHFAINSWNLAAECEFVRRQIELLRPDLVIQVSVSNDVDDVSGVRGFGTEATFVPAVSGRADSILLSRYPKVFLEHDESNLLGLGFDHESRGRFVDALAAVRRLRATLAALPGSPRHLLVFHWGPLNPIAHARLGSSLEPESVLYLPLAFSIDKTAWVTPLDPHWGERGHERVAQVLYGVIRERGLLPGTGLAAWPEADDTARAWAASGRAEAEGGDQRIRAVLGEFTARIEPPLDAREARQIHGGLDMEGLVSPYASFVLLRAGADELAVRGHCLPDEALRGASVRVSLEELELGVLELEPRRELDFRAPIPAELGGRELLNVRFSADDWVYRGDNLRHCVVFRLDSVALE